MPRLTSCLCAAALALAVASPALAQDPAPRGEKAFQAADTNGDAKITRDEYLAEAKKRAEMRFLKLDANNDGVLTKDELLKPGKPRAPRPDKTQAPAAQ
uniref:EF-hand domain-containing protein n=1 Tax=Fundidesulfovibrio putealis TaxID=270496 RepID=A0A7C4AGU6_9BACT